MQLARMVSTSVFVLVLGLAGLAGGCGSGSQSPQSTNTPAEDDRTREDKKQAHQKIKENFKKIEDGANKRSATRKGPHRGPE